MVIIRYRKHALRLNSIQEYILCAIHRGLQKNEKTILNLNANMYVQMYMYKPFQWVCHMQVFKLELIKCILKL